MSRSGTNLTVDPWLVRTAVNVPIKQFLHVPFVLTPGLPTPVEQPEVVAAKTHAILTSLSFGDHSNPDTLQRMLNVPMYLPAGTTGQRVRSPHRFYHAVSRENLQRLQKASRCAIIRRITS